MTLFVFWQQLQKKKDQCQKFMLAKKKKSCSVFQQVLRYECKYFKPSENAFEMNFNTFVMYFIA